MRLYLVHYEKRIFQREREFTQFNLDKKGKLTNTQWIILGILIFLLIVFIIAVNYSGSVKNIFIGRGELATEPLLLPAGEILPQDPTCWNLSSNETCINNLKCKWVSDRCGYESGCITFGYWDCIKTEGCKWSGLFYGSCYAGGSCSLNTPPNCKTKSPSVCGLVPGRCVPR